MRPARVFSFIQLSNFRAWVETDGKKAEAIGVRKAQAFLTPIASAFCICGIS